jgi:TPR repeat protein
MRAGFLLFLAGLLASDARAAPVSACAPLDDPGCYTKVGELLKAGDLAAASRLSEELCARKYGRSCVLDGMIGALLRDLARAQKRLTVPCDRGDLQACVGLGSLEASNDWGVKQGSVHLKKACDGGLAAACQVLKAVQDRESRKTAAAAATGANPCGSLELAACNVRATELIANGRYTEAQPLVVHLCGLRVPKACGKVAAVAAMKRDPLGARPVLKKACEQGASEACGILKRAGSTGETSGESP